MVEKNDREKMVNNEEYFEMKTTRKEKQYNKFCKSVNN